MPSGTDFFNQLKGSNLRLDQLIENTDDLEGSLAQLVASNGTINDTLVHQVRQNETIICLLRQIAANTCTLVNESHTQTGFQTGMSTDTRTLADLYAITHAEAALLREREAELRRQIEACCPPVPPAPPCQEEKCAEPSKYDGPPVILKPKPRRRQVEG